MARVSRDQFPIQKRIALAALSGSSLFAFFLITADSPNLGFTPLFLGLIGVAILICVRNLWLDIQRFRHGYGLKAFLPTVTALLFFALINALIWYQNPRDDGRVTMMAVHDGGTNLCLFRFFDDGRFVFENSSALGGYITRGRYILQDGTITLDRKQVDNVISHGRLLISVRGISNPRAVVLQIDEHGTPLSDCIEFEMFRDSTEVSIR